MRTRGDLSRNDGTFEKMVAALRVLCKKAGTKQRADLRRQAILWGEFQPNAERDNNAFGDGADSGDNASESGGANDSADNDSADNSTPGDVTLTLYADILS
eukprot:GHVS01026101.1.p1 GENE.GHVS01026101.1~~GHVS01026101.1.p1  ORF type:complete len:101 (-),score=18.28 GHVS01026101.1:135-437(-)